MKASMTKVDDADPTPPPSAFVQIPRWGHAQLRRGFLSHLGFTASYRIWLALWNNSERQLAPALHVRIIAKSWSHSSPRLEERENPAPGSSEGGDHGDVAARNIETSFENINGGFCSRDLEVDDA